MGLSKSAVDKLGERLRTGAATDADWTLLEDLRADRQAHLSEVMTQLRELGLEVTGRVKTTNTLVEKLQRERMRFSQMDDLAGARIKVEGTRLDQDAVVTRLLERWPDARVKDRRTEPVHGYRAVHVIPTIEGWPLEIQVRTMRQDTMANILERLGDQWGRQIRYGEEPTRSDAPAVPGRGFGTRSDFLAFVHQTADTIAKLESLHVRLGTLTAQQRSIDLDDLERTVDGLVSWLRTRLSDIVGD